MTASHDAPPTCMIPLPENLIRKMQARHPMFTAERTEVLLATRIAAHCIETGLGAFLAKHDLTIAKFNLLMALYVHHPDSIPSSDLAHYWIGTRANLSQLVTGLTQSNLIASEPSPDDARARLLRLAPEGLHIVEKILPQHISRVNKASAGLTTKERRELIRLLMKLKDSYQVILDADTACSHSATNE